MSYASISQAAADQDLAARTSAAVNKEALSNAKLAGTMFGQQVLAGTALISPRFSYPVAVANEAAYESALAAGNPRPGWDPAVITDGDILAAVQVNWPPDPT